MTDGKGSVSPEQQQLFHSRRSPDSREALLQERSRLLGKAAHEIYNSSTFLVANLTTLRGDILADALDPELAIEMIDECLEGMGRTTDVLRRVRELSREKKSLPLESLELSTVVANVCTRIGARRGIELSTELEPVQVRASLDVLAHVVEQLIEVWLRRLPPLEATVGLGLQISVRSDESGGVLELISVGKGDLSRDSGPLFEAFRQGDSDEHGTRLYVSRCMIEDMGGRLDAEVDEGQAILSLRLPRV